MYCNVCGSKLSEDAKFCAECGAPVSREKICTKCGNKLTPEQKFCPQCGTPAENEQSEPQSKKKEKQGIKELKFKSNVVEDALKKIPGNVIDEQEAKDISQIISMHALGAAASGAATAWIPGAGATAATASQIVFIWTMYARIGTRMGINLSKKKMKFLGSAVLSNIATAAGSFIVASTVSLIPGVGSVAAVLLMAGAGYAMITVAGIFYVNLMSSAKEKGIDISTMSDEQLKEKMSELMKEQNVRGMMKEAQGEYVKARKAGTVTGKETVELEEE